MLNPVSKESVNLTQQNIEKLKELFPEILTDGNKVDFEMLQTILGEEIDGEKERYSFTWPGKRDAIIGAQQPSKGTLRPNKEKSKDFDATENLYIEGDNLEVLKLLQKPYNKKIKMIYIDPPYNTGGDFIYKDNFRDGIENYLEQTRQVDSEGNLLSTNSESNGRFHTNWLNMMYPRLKLARNLLTEDGVIFISIDNNEEANLIKICDEIFGEHNFISNLTIETSRGVFGAKASHIDKTIIKNKDYVLVYAMNPNQLDLQPLYTKSKKLFDAHFTFYKNGEIECHLNDFLKAQDMLNEKAELLNITNNVNNLNTLMEIFPDVNDFILSEAESIYRIRDYTLSVPKEYKEEIDRGKKVIINGNYVYKNETGNIMYLYPWTKLLNDTDDYQTEYTSSVVVGDLWSGYNDDMGNIGKEGGVKFSNGKKPVRLIKNMLKLINDKDALILDFFSGSATTAHACLQLNSEDGGKRKFIMVQLPETLEESSATYKDGFRNITDIAIERIRRAGEKILKEKPELGTTLDTGFKYLHLDKSNIKEWNTDFDHLEDELDLFADVFVDGRMELDVVYEIMLKHGLELTLPVQSFEIDGKKIYDIAFGLQFICLADDIDTNVVKAIINKRDEYGKDTISGVVFKDTGFNGNDSEKLNCIQLLKDAGFIEENLQTI